MNHRIAEIRFSIQPSEQHGLEIGPLDKPIVKPTEGDIAYLDHLSTEDLRIKYKDDPNVNCADIVEVTYVWGERTLAEAVGKTSVFDYVIASHVIEHVPDLIGWLQEVTEVLKPGGVLSLAIPDKRYCFDYLRNLSTAGDAIDAYLAHRRRPSVRHVFDHYSTAVVINTGVAWAGGIDVCSLQHLFGDNYPVRSATTILTGCPICRTRVDFNFIWSPHLPGKRITQHQESLYMSKRQLGQSQETSAAKASISDRSGRRIEKGERQSIPGERHWRTREDPFETIWEKELVPLLEQEAQLTGLTLWEYLEDEHAGKFPYSVLRTLQRRVKHWKATQGPDKVVIFRQSVPAGQQGLSDFSHPNTEITIQGEVFAHLLYNSALLIVAGAMSRSF